MREELVLFDADYELDENKGVILLYCRDSKGKSVLVKDKNFNTYFYVLPKTGRIDEVKKKIHEIDEKKTGTRILGVEVFEMNWLNKNEKVLKVVIENPRRIHDVRDAVKHWKEIDDTFEYDITYYKRYLIDKRLEPMGWLEVNGEVSKDKGKFKVDYVIKATSVKFLGTKKAFDTRVAAFDTEWIEERNESKLIMLSLSTSDGLKKVITTYDWENKPPYVESVKDEKGIIERFLELVEKEDPDIIVGYNSDGFDFPELRDKASEFKLQMRIGRDDSQIFVVRRGRISSAKSKGRIHIDLFGFIKHILGPSMKSEVFSLDEVAQELLGAGKKDMTYKEMVEIWSKKKELERLAEYNMWDSELTLRLAQHVLPQIIAISRLTGQLPFDAGRYTYSQLVEGFYMRKASEDKVLVPNRPITEEIEARKEEPAYKGAIVIEPKKGIHSDILVFDFRSLYPTIIVTHNIDPWTYNFKPCKKKEQIPQSDSYFCADSKGFIPKHLEEIIERRRQIKAMMNKEKKESGQHKLYENEQYALKILANATYGYLGYFGAKWYKREAGAAAASWGRHYIGLVVEEAKKFGFEVIYGDTDSLMVSLGKTSTEKLENMGSKFEATINKKLPGIIELEFRAVYEGGIFVARQKGEVGAKKRYALLDHKGGLEIRGFETVRRDWCQLSKDIQREVLTVVLKEKDPVKAVTLVRETIKKVKEGKVPLDQLIILEQITRPISQYEQMGPHVRAAMKSIERGRPVGEGNLIAFIIVKGRGSISERAEPVEDVKQNQYDPDYYVEHQILPASMRVLKGLGYTEEEVQGGKIQKRLEAWTKK
ncbi:MAG: ribonuclease H-like domain-containing protein [Candidatus Aenigmarchaeota archaeon]|nr:ribonuclease H-like domain-containing protein [Candidatus Aenigmarchaeota archaeon]